MYFDPFQNQMITLISPNFVPPPLPQIELQGMGYSIVEKKITRNGGLSTAGLALVAPSAWPPSTERGWAAAYACSFRK